MKKINVINLIKYYAQQNDMAFRDEAHMIATAFNESGDYELAHYILALLNNQNVFIPQENGLSLEYLTLVETPPMTLPLPTLIMDDLMGIINAIGYGVGVNKFLFTGNPGTGKTESAKQLARILNRQLYSVEFDQLVDSKMGQTAKNIAELFAEINAQTYPEQKVILFDELDALALDRTNNRDIREMGRATSAVLKGLDSLNSRIVLLATTNLHKSFDKALLRRFDNSVDFNRYTQKELAEVAESILEEQLAIFNIQGRNIRLFRKIIQLLNPIPYPGELKNLIRSSIAFSTASEPFDYLNRLLRQIHPSSLNSYGDLHSLGFSLRDIELLTKVSKSQLSRSLTGEKR
ncbi:MAG: ATP-binding protein [Bacteriovoracaceae bacterium]